MRTVHCPLCGLRYTHASELDVHVREDHCPEPPPERQEAIRVRAARPVLQDGLPRLLTRPW